MMVIYQCIIAEFLLIILLRPPTKLFNILDIICKIKSRTRHASLATN
uniref:Uncharacterized protein n=1 Tax=Rhizophora mucronata TaxID=61149 RepID=A0A2P2NWP3_RHIMU